MSYKIALLWISVHLNVSSVVFFQDILGLPFLRPSVRLLSIATFSRRSSFVLKICPHHLGLLSLIVCKTSCLTITISRTLKFLTFSNINVLADLLQKSILIKRIYIYIYIFFFCERFKAHVSPYSIVHDCTIN